MMYGVNADTAQHPNLLISGTNR